MITFTDEELKVIEAWLGFAQACEDDAVGDRDAVDSAHDKIICAMDDRGLRDEPEGDEA